MATRKTTTRSEAELKKAKRGLTAPEAKPVRKKQRAGRKTKLTLDALARFPGQNPNPVLRMGMGGLLLYANKASAPLLKQWGCRKGGTLPPEWRKRIDKALSDRQRITVDEPCGKRIYLIDVVPVKDTDYVNLYCRDATEQKRAEQVLRESENRYRSLFENMLDGFAFCRMIYSRGKPKDFVYLAVNDAFERLTGLKNVVGKKVSEMIPGIKKSNPELFEIYGRVASSGKQERFESYLESLGIWFSVFVYSTQKEYFTAVFENISERKQAAEALRQSEAKYRSIFDNAAEGIFQSTPEGKFLTANPAMARILGFSSSEELIRERTDIARQSYVHPEQREEFKRLMEQQNKVSGFEYEVPRKDGSVVWISEMAQAVRDATGRIVHYEGIFIDITERKQAEEALRILNSRQEAILDAVPDIIMEVDENKVYTWANRPGMEFFGDDVIGREALYYFEGEQETYDKVKPLFNGDENTIYVESWQRRKDGQKRLLAWWCRVLKDDNGRVTGALSTARDITERRRAEEALYEREEKYRNIFENIQDVYYEVDIDGTILEISPSIGILSHYKREELIGKSLYDYYADPQARQKLLETIQTAGQVTDYEVLLKNGDGSLIPCSIIARLVPDDKKKSKKIVGSMRNISERKRYEKRILDSLKEKDVLLKEIHHRVKNNMQIMISLLRLQMSQIENAAVQDILKESQDRIQSMALVHEALYQLGNLAEVELGSYLQNFSNMLYTSYGTDPSRIKLQVDAEDVKLGIDQAVPCGLIVHELVSNALKHAFPADWKKTGRIHVLLRRQGDGIELSVKDNGIGLPEGIDFGKSETLGMKLVMILADQLKAKIVLEKRQGTRIGITFRADK